MLVGPASVDRYVETGEQVPGGGALNMAYHWVRQSLPFRLATRISASDAPLFMPFLAHNGIRVTEPFIVAGGSCSVDVAFGPDRQPIMDHFVEGVWESFEWGRAELDAVLGGAPTHLVLVDVVDAALTDLVALTTAHQLARTNITGDFLSFRHFDLLRFHATFRWLDVGFIGWPGEPDDPLVADLVTTPRDYGNVLVLTFGSRGVRVVDGRPGSSSDRWFDVEARQVEGTTIGCGDAFTAAFLAAWRHRADVTDAVDAGRELGARATRWRRALPDEAYG